MNEPQKLGPERMPFMWPRIGGAVFLAAVLSVAVLVVSVFVGPVALVAMPLVWLGVAPLIYGAHVAFGKETYEIHPNHLVRRYGGLFSDGRNELEVRNITHVRIRLPWLRHRFFGIGDVRVESAGSAQAEITFESVKEPEALYEALQERMRTNGYQLGRGEVLHEESPTAVGAISDVVQTMGGALFALAWFGFAGAGLLVGTLEELDLGVLSLPAILLVGVGGLALLGFGVVVRYLDITRRTYTVFDDVVEYTEGFLTRDNAFIPFENIADAGMNRTFVDQMLGLYDVTVSCQGSGSEVKFRRLSGGPALQSAINTLVANARTAERPAAPEPAGTAPSGEGSLEADPKADSRAAPAQAPRKRIAADDAWTAELKMNLTRAIVQTVPLIFTGPVWLMVIVGAAIRATNTTYQVGADSLSSDFTFFGSKNLQFAYDKVTGVQLVRNPIDSFFDTVTIQIWSIGSSQPLVLQHIDSAAVDLPALLRQCGIESDEPSQGALSQSFGFRVWLIQNVGFLVFLGIAVVVGLIGALFIHPVLALGPLFMVVLPVPAAVLTRMRVDRQELTFHESHLQARTGILLRRETYARYDSLKKVETIAIPFTEQGRFRVYVAGERLIQQGNNGTAIVPYVIEGAYIEDIHHRVDAMDALLLGRIGPDAIAGVHDQGDDLVQSVQPAVANTAVVIGVIGAIIWPLLLILPIRIWQLKVARYDIESDRVVYRAGILFKSATSVLFDRIDSLQQNQGALGKAFSNGSVTLLTAGSSRPDLVIANVPDHESVYETIRASYG